jgi:hypothetical protein
MSNLALQAMTANLPAYALSDLGQGSAPAGAGGTAGAQLSDFKDSLCIAGMCTSFSSSG